MMSLIEIQRALKDRRIGIISQYTGVHVNTIREIRDNPLANPTHNVMLRLSNYLTENL
jgi:hypothetical protein